MSSTAMLTPGSVSLAFGALAGVLALIWGGQWVARRRLLPRGRRLQLAETIALDAKRRVHLVRCDTRFMLLQTGGGQDVLIGWLPDAAAPPSSQA